MNKILEANGLNMDKLREIEKFHPGFKKCVLDMAASSVVGSTCTKSNIIQRAMAFLNKKRRQFKNNSEDNIEYILKDNGVEVEKLKEIDK